MKDTLEALAYVGCLGIAILSALAVALLPIAGLVWIVTHW